MLVYVWSRRNPFVRMNFLGFLNFNAPYLPWVLMAFNVFINNHWPWSDIQGLIIGHIFYFLEDVYPRMPSSGGRKLLEAPRFLKHFFQTRDRADAALPNAAFIPQEVPNAIPEARNLQREEVPEEQLTQGDRGDDREGILRQRVAHSGRE